MIYLFGNFLSDYVVILSVFIGLCVTAFIILIAYAYLPPIAPIFSLFMEKVKRDTKKLLERGAKHNENVDFEKWVSIAYNRLGYRHTYTYFKQCVSELTLIITLVSLVLFALAFVLLILSNIIFAFIFIIIAIVILYKAGDIAYKIQKDNLISEINKLNKSQITELPIIMAEMISIVPVISRINIITFLNQYLTTAGSLSSDIRTYLNQGSSVASIEKWKERVMTYATVDVSDYIRFIELLQNAFLEGYTNTTSQSLYKLRDNIQSKVIDRSMRDALDSNKQLFDTLPTVMVLTAITLVLIPYIFQFLSMSSM